MKNSEELESEVSEYLFNNIRRENTLDEIIRTEVNEFVIRSNGYAVAVKVKDVTADAEDG